MLGHVCTYEAIHIVVLNQWQFFIVYTLWHLTESKELSKEQS